MNLVVGMCGPRHRSPQIFSPVEIDGGLYADGGFVEYLPVETLQTLGCDFNVGSSSSMGSIAERPRWGYAE